MANKTPFILLPPSEGKAQGGDRPPVDLESLSFPSLNAQRRTAMDGLARAMKWSGPKRAKLLGVKGDALLRATEANADLDRAPTLPAIERYTGVMYEAIEHRTLSRTAKRRFEKQVILFSGLWGIVGPADRIPDYRLKMGATLPRLAKLSSWWRPAIADALDARMGTNVVWDLLPNEHRAATDVNPEWITVKFLDEVDRRGERRLATVSHWSKLLKGALVRFILENQITDPHTLSEFSHPESYTYAPNLSTSTDVKMIRRL